MTLLTVLLLTLVSTCLAQQGDNNNTKERPSRAPQSQIQYSDPHGAKVDWKLYAPQNQWRSHLASSQRLQRAETGTTQAHFPTKQQAPVIQAPAQLQPQYQPFSAVPSHIKQLITETYSHGGPYVDPGAFFYQAFAPIAVSSLAPQVNNEQYAHPQARQLEREYFTPAVSYHVSPYHGNDGLSSGGQIGSVPPKAGIKYKDEERLTERAASLPYGSVIGAQSREKSQYQPYRHISQTQQPQYTKQSSDLQPQYTQYPKQNSDARAPVSQYKPNSAINTQYSQYNKQSSQFSQYNKQSPQFTQHNKQSPQYSQYNKQLPQPQAYKQSELIKQVIPMNYETNMPMAIKQLLSYQAQLPYDVIANQIVFRPKQPFIPKPLPESAKLSKQYPTKIYFLKTDGQIYENPEPIMDENKNAKRY